MTLTDPFADAPADEAQTAPSTSPWEEKTAAPVVVGGSDGKVVVTLKGGTGYDEPWIVIHASDVDDALETLSNKALGALIARTKEVGTFFSGSNKTVQVNPAPTQPGRPAGASQAPGGQAKYCEHGERLYKTGVAKTGKNAGKVWEAYDCPQRVCEREWKN